MRSRYTYTCSIQIVLGVACFLCLAVLLPTFSSPNNPGAPKMDAGTTTKESKGGIFKASMDVLKSLSSPEYSYFADKSQVAIYSLFLGGCHTLWLPVTGARGAAYASLHGYSYYALVMPHPMECSQILSASGRSKERCAKLQKYAVGRALMDHYKWVVYHDSDAAMYRCGLKLEQFLDGYSSLYLSSFYPDTPLLINTGSFIIGGNQFGRSFIDDVLSAADGPPLYPVALGQTGKPLNLSQYEGYALRDDQKWVVDAIALRPFHSVHVNVKFLPPTDFQCLIERNCDKGQDGLAFIIHCAFSCGKAQKRVKTQTHPECDDVERRVERMEELLGQLKCSV